MKRYLLLILIIGAPYFSASAQNLTYQKVVEADGLTPAQIIDRANRWAVAAYQNYQSVVQLREADQLVLNGNFKSLIQVNKYQVPMTYIYQLKIEGKENRYRLTVQNIQRSDATGTTKSMVYDRESATQQIDGFNFKPKQREMAIQQMESEFTALDAHFAQLFAAVKASIQATPKKDDW